MFLPININEFVNHRKAGDRQCLMEAVRIGQ